MTSIVPNHDSPAEEATGTPTPKRRKVRKGTQSCWECKRRKIRCTFSVPSETTCDGCRSRRTRCIGQEFSDETLSPHTQPGRLIRAGEYVNHEAWGQDQSKSRAERRCDIHESGNPSNKYHPRGVAQPTTIDLRDMDDSRVISNTLIQLWPDKSEIEAILRVSVDISAIFHGVVCLPYSEFLASQITTARQIFQGPQDKSRPIFIARRLLMIASILQAMAPSSIDKLSGEGFDAHAVRSRVFTTVTRLVTSNEKFVNSIEGIECVMMESMYLNNAGKLRRAWLTNRKAMMIAQMMGIHKNSRYSHPQSPVYLSPATRDRIDSSYMWFRLVSNDRYLSMMLGLPQCIEESIFFPAPTIRETCSPIEHFERAMTAAGGLILQRGHSNSHAGYFQETLKIDKSLQDAAAMMSPQWWLLRPPSPSFQINTFPTTTEVETIRTSLQETIRQTNHFTYHHLLIQLHLPHMLPLPLSSSPPSAPHDQESHAYANLTAASSSRSLLTQYLDFREPGHTAATISNKDPSTYCKGIDYLAFIAGVALCLAHMESRRRSLRRVGVDHGNDAAAAAAPLRSLHHQRPVDRGLLEGVLRVMRGDSITSSSSSSSSSSSGKERTDGLGEEEVGGEEEEEEQEQEHGVAASKKKNRKAVGMLETLMRFEEDVYLLDLSKERHPDDSSSSNSNPGLWDWRYRVDYYYDGGGGGASKEKKKGEGGLQEEKGGGVDDDGMLMLVKIDIPHFGCVRIEKEKKEVVHHHRGEDVDDDGTGTAGDDDGDRQEEISPVVVLDHHPHAPPPPPVPDDLLLPPPDLDSIPVMNGDDDDDDDNGDWALQGVDMAIFSNLFAQQQ